MGLLIKLQNGDTQLKSLKFGSDRLGGGDSGQPYIQTSVDTEPGQDAGIDFLLRGGINAPADALTDVKRLTKYMFDLKSPSGGLFVVKQNLLSRVSPKTEASKGLGYAFGALNNGVYTPLSTLAQAGIGFLGGHVNKQGLDPTGLFPGLSIKKYEKVVFDNNKENNNTLSADDKKGKFDNRLLEIWFEKQYKTTESNDVLKYGGGPGSFLGVGKTHIEFAKDGDGASLRTGLNNVNLPNAFTTNFGYDNYSVFNKPRQVLWNGAKIFVKNLTVSGKYKALTGIDPLNDEYSTTNNSINLQLFPNSVYSSGSLDPFTNLSGPYGYLTERKSKKPTTEEDSYPFFSPIENILNKTYNRQLLSPPQFDDHGITNSNKGGLARTWGVTSDGNLIGRYSSDKTLKRDYTNDQISGSYNNALWDDFNKYYGFGNGSTYHTDGYLADLDKNAGTWKVNGILVGNNNNAYPGGISPDFRLVPREIRGLFPFLNTQKPNTFRDDNGVVSRDAYGEISTTWIDEGGNLKSNTLDKIYYNSNKSSFRTSNPLNAENDLIKFRISIINPTLPNEIYTLNFRAYIDSLSDSYAADWKSQTYMGRGEKFYKYNSFERDISLAFTIVADNKTNLDTMYTQLNVLASSLAPTYTGQGYMAGNLHKLTIGNYIYEQPGILTSLTYDIMDESPWEIEEGSQVPFYIKVTGIKFIPIHQFRPESEFNNSHAYIKQ